jgi:hypothetical protein
VTRPRLLLLPGYSELEWVIRPQLEEWAEVAAFDAPGVGGEPPPVAYDSSAVADRAAAEIDRLGDVRWWPLATIAEAGFLSRRVGRTLELRAFARRIRVEVPADVDELVVELAPGHREPEHEAAVGGAARARFAGRTAALPVDGPGPLEISLVRDDAVDPQRTPAPPWRPWPLARRLLTEGRDRMIPVVSRPRRAIARS